ncbi:MAG: nucleotidyltransferase domain-containing protein [Terrimicrobiaceae bacterium]
MKTQVIREEVLRDPRSPLHSIADRLLPYLRVLVDQFQPEKVLVFGSFAYGTPGEHSDVDLLVVMPIRQSRLKDKVAIRAAWWPLLRQGSPLSFDLMLAAPEESAILARDAKSFHSEILRKGVRVI